MLTVETINVNNIVKNNQNMSFGSCKRTFNSSVTPYDAYQIMNRNVNMDYASGDISLLGLLANKLNNFWNIVMHKDPSLEIKAMLIEESLKQSAQNNRLNAVA